VKWIKASKRLMQGMMQIRARTTRLLAAVVLSVLFIAIVALGHSQQVSQPRQTDRYEQITSQDKIRSKSKAEIGMFVQKVYDLNPQTKIFAADGYVWVRWKGKIEAWDRVTQDDPALTLEFLNAVEQWDFAKTLSPEDPYTDQDGWSYQAVLFSGKFIASDINLRRFPFERLTLPIEIGTDDFWTTDLVLEPDNKQALAIAAKETLQGYSLISADFQARKHIYNTSMGLHGDALRKLGTPDVAAFPNFVANIHYERVFTASAWQLLLPLTIVTLIAFLTPVIDARAIEAKIALPATVLITLVFLQEGYKEILPRSLAYLTFMDKIYTATYLATLALVAETIWVANRLLQIPEAERGKEAARMKRVESRNNLIILTTLAISIMMLWKQVA